MENSILTLREHPLEDLRASTSNLPPDIKREDNIKRRTWWHKPIIILLMGFLFQACVKSVGQFFGAVPSIMFEIFGGLLSFTGLILLPIGFILELRRRKYLKKTYG